MRLPLLGPSVPSKSVEQNKRSLVNMYLTPAQFNPNYEVVAYSRQGLKTWKDLSGSEVRAMYAQNDVLYTVVDNKFYKVARDLTATELGTLQTTSGPCQIKGSQVDIFVNDTVKGYNYAIESEEFTVVTSAGFPAGTKTIAAQDGYIVAHSSDSFFLSNFQDGTTWDVLDFASAEGDPDDIIALESFQRKLFLLGRISTEIWFNTGDADFPFSRIEGVYINYGCEAVNSVTIGDNNIYWLARGRDGQLCALSVDESYRDVIISTDALNTEFQTYAVTDDATGFVYQREGKEFFVLTFPTQGKTWVYDTKLGVWCEYSSFVNGADTRWLANNHASVFGKNLTGDYKSGIIYELDEETFTDNNETITRRIKSSPHMAMQQGKQAQFVTNKTMFINRLEVDIESGQGSVNGQGEDPQMMLRVSLDGGFTFGNIMYRSANKIGDYTPRLYWNRLGSSRRAVFELTMTDPIKWVVLGAWVEMKQGRE